MEYKLLPNQCKNCKNLKVWNVNSIIELKNNIPADSSLNCVCGKRFTFIVDEERCELREIR